MNKKSGLVLSLTIVSLLLCGCRGGRKPSPTSGSVTNTSQKTSGSNTSGGSITSGGSATTVTSVTSESSSSSTTSHVPTTSEPEPGDYYASIKDSYEGDTLLSALQTLNKSKRKSVVGYNSMGTSASGMYKYTDYDPNSTISYDENGQPYGSRILSFYSGTSCTSFNREHVWPNSRGGGSKGNSKTSPHVDQDIYMPRPTVPAENSNRGNSSYVEGIAHSSNGWDPIQAFEVEDPSVGTYQSIRGECARIIFYCMTADSNLKLVDDPNIDFDGEGGRVTMGKLSDLLRWNLDNPVNPRELTRQSGGEYLQGNRNAFVDHPSYACRIWGNTNSTTKSICGM